MMATMFRTPMECRSAHHKHPHTELSRPVDTPASEYYASPWPRSNLRRCLLEVPAMPDWLANIKWTDWISSVGSVASIGALCLAIWEWRRVKTVRQELEQQRNHFAKLHFLAEHLRQLVGHRKSLVTHRGRKRWEQTGTELYRFLGTLETMHPRLDESAWESYGSLVSEIGTVLKQVPVGDDRTMTTAVSTVIGRLDHFTTIVNNTLEEYHWREKS